MPVLEEASTIDRLLDSLAAVRGIDEVVIVDGGSRDDTLERAARHPSRPATVSSERGRARQMNLGAQIARGEVLLFLHADTRLPHAAGTAVVAAAGAGGAAGGNFAIRFDGGGGFSCLLGAVYRVQNAVGVFYGDSAIWVRRDVFDALGGYRDIPIMEDYDLARRLRTAGRVRRIPLPVTTSARRWRRHGIARSVATWVLIRYLFLLGVPARRLAGMYPHAR